MRADEQRRSAILAIYEEDRDDALDVLFAPQARHHRSSSPLSEGPDGARQLLRELQERLPGAVATVKRTAVDGDLVGVHWHASPDPDDEFTGESWAEFFRFEGDQVVEHWDLHVEAPASTVSGRSVFSDAYPSAPSPGDVDAATTASNRATAASAFARFLEFDPAVVASHWGEVYLQHNESIPDGTPALLQSLEEIGGLPAANRPSFSVIATLADDDLVWFLERVRVGEETGFGADIFRLADGRIVEHWDIPAMRPPIDIN